jgi:hypothetical protein
MIMAAARAGREQVKVRIAGDVRYAVMLMTAHFKRDIGLFNLALAHSARRFHSRIR